MLNQHSDGARAPQECSDTEYFAAHPEERLRFSVRGLDSKTGFFSFDVKTREGGHLSGDVWDLLSALNNFRRGTPRQRLLKALRLMPLCQLHRIERGAPDLICGSRCFWDGSSFGAWVTAHG